MTEFCVYVVCGGSACVAIRGHLHGIGPLLPFPWVSRVELSSSSLLDLKLAGTLYWPREHLPAEPSQGPFSYSRVARPLFWLPGRKMPAVPSPVLYVTAAVRAKTHRGSATGCPRREEVGHSDVTLVMGPECGEDLRRFVSSLGSCS